MTRIVILSDIHLSPTHGFFWENFCVARDRTNELKPDAVIVTGDLCINGPDSDAEIEFAASALAGLKGPVLAIPGNHDIGDEPPGQDAKQLIDVDRLGRWDRSFGADRWRFVAGGWRLIGLNAQLFGSGLEREDEQRRWLETELEAAAGHPVALFLHKPVFLEDVADPVASESCMVPAARARFLELLKQRDVRLVVTGHLHQHRDRTIDGVRHLWAPSTAFTVPHDLGGDGRCAFLILDLAPDGATVSVERPRELISHDLMAIKQHGRYKFLRDMPHCPPKVAA